MKKLVGKGKPLHSAVDKAAKVLKRKVGTGAEFMKELMGLPGIKQTEIQERGLGDLMGMPRMTHDQFMANLAIRPAPAIQEKVLSDEDEGEDDPRYLTPEERNYGPDNQTHHRKWTLPGGKNYREMLIKAPKPQGHGEKLMELEAKLRRAPPDKVDHYEALIDKYQKLASQDEQYPGNPNHFGGEPGILASMRLKDRLVPDLEGPHNVKIVGGGGASNKKFNTREEAEAFANVKHQGGYRTEITPLNNKKYLHLEELQSDWHQAGRQKGYHDPEKLAQADATIRALKAEHKRLGEVKALAQTPEEREAISQQRLGIMDQIFNATILPSDHVPDAPFKKNWEEMALKRLIHHAAEKGYHGIVVTPGEEQADRYSLAKQINHIEYDPIDKTLFAQGKNGKVIDSKSNPEDLPNHVGKDVADKLLQAPLENGRHKLFGLDLRTGDEAMKAFYDKKVPNILNSIGKKYGVKTQLHGQTIGKPSETNPNNLTLPGYEAKPAPTTQLHYFPITEEMRKDVLTNGLPLYSQGGKVHMADGGDMDTMRLELLNRHLKGEKLSEAQNEILGLYHRVGGGKKLQKPISEYKFTTAPNPNVNMAPEKLISPEDLYGGLGMPLVGDSSMAGRLLTGAEGTQFQQPIELQGGHDYMRANALHADPSKRAIWASGKGEVSTILKKAQHGAEEGKPMYGIHASMSPTGVDFSHMPAEVLAELVKNAKITKKARAEFDKEMRAQHPDFPGVVHPELHDMLREPGAGELRKHFVERMATDPYQNAGFPEIAMARLAVQHPNLMKHDIKNNVFVGSSIGKFDPNFRRFTDPVHPHHSYPDVIAGEYQGAFHPETAEPLLTTQDLFPEFYKMRREFEAPVKGDRRSFERSKPVQKFDQEWLDKVMPIYLARRKQILGYRKGGKIKKMADGGLLSIIKDKGVEEAPDMDVKAFIMPRAPMSNSFPVGGIQQPPQAPQMPQQSAPAPQEPQGAPFQPAQAPAQPPSNILQMTRQGQALNAIRPPQMAKGGSTRRVAYNPGKDAMMLELMQAKRHTKRK